MTTFHLAGFPRVGAKRELNLPKSVTGVAKLQKRDLLDIAKDYAN